MNNKASAWAWLILLALTGFSTALAESSLSGSAILIPVLLATLIKGRIVIDSFMAMRQAPLLWRGVVLGWLIVVVGLITVAFRNSQI